MLDWSANSLGNKPIEHPWDDLNKRSRQHDIKTVELALIAEWTAIPQTFFFRSTTTWDAVAKATLTPQDVTRGIKGGCDFMTLSRNFVFTPNVDNRLWAASELCHVLRIQQFYVSKWMEKKVKSMVLRILNLVQLLANRKRGPFIMTDGIDIWTTSNDKQDSSWPGASWKKTVRAGGPLHKSSLPSDTDDDDQHFSVAQCW